MRVWAGIFLSFVLALGLTDASSAHPGVPGKKVSVDKLGADIHATRQPAAGVTPTFTDNFEVLGHLRLPGGSLDADVSFFDYGHRTFAFVGSWRDHCDNDGVKIIDVSRPRHPELVAIARGPGDNYSSEDMAIEPIGDRIIMAVGFQACGSHNRRGMGLFDVSTPGKPEFLSIQHTPGGGVHELDVVTQPDGTVLALLATPFTEFNQVFLGAQNGGEVRIVDITHPAHPDQIANWGIVSDSGLDSFGGDPITGVYMGLGGFAAYFAHSVRGADDGQTAYVSYWDAGVIKLDISDPTSPVVVGRTQYGPGDDGEGHSMTPFEMGGTRYILQNDEDGDPDSPLTLTSDVTGASEYTGIDMYWMPATLDAGSVSGTFFDAADGCQAGDYAGAAGMVAVADTQDWYYEGVIPGWQTAPCRLQRQTKLAAAAGASALVSNFVTVDDPWYYPFRAPNAIAGDEDMIVVQTAAADGLVDAIRTAGGPATITLAANTPAIGYLRVFDESSTMDADGDGFPEFEQVGSFTDLPHSVGDPSPPPRGTWEIHNTEAIGDRAYSSWYSHGIVALDMTDPTAPSLVGQFVPRAERYALVWGVAIDPESGLIYASDMQNGLWIVKPTGAAAPTP